MNMRRGFTVVELVITITIMAILLTLGVVNMRGSQANSRDAERKADIETIAKHLETYYTSGTDGQTPTYEYPSTELVSNGTSYMTQVLRDINVASLTAPGIDDPVATFIPATNNVQSIAGILPQPTINQYIYQPIRKDGTLCDPSNSNIVVDALIVGGGGGGGAGWQGGGGGGGGYIYEQNIPISINNYEIQVGEGGAGGNTLNGYIASSGENSSFNSRVAIGGGRGAGEPMGSSYGSLVGGSGGGG
ncbi:MAG: type II secretion system protein, partial [Candidatus Saccharimonadales bacterium]